MSHQAFPRFRRQRHKPYRAQPSRWEAEDRQPLHPALPVIAAVLCVLILYGLWLPQDTAPVPEAAEPAAALPAASPTAKAVSAAPLPTEDPALLLVNGDTPLPADHAIQPRFIEDVAVDVLAYDALCTLLADASAQGLSLWVASGYRSVQEQEALLQAAVDSRLPQFSMDRAAALADAKRTMQLPGCSEHHTGLAVDFNTVSQDFADTPESAWLQANAEAYGFVLRYPPDKAAVTGIAYEPWHYRYVGVEHAKCMNILEYCLEEYVLFRKNA